MIASSTILLAVQAFDEGMSGKENTITNRMEAMEKALEAIGRYTKTEKHERRKAPREIRPN